MALSQLKNRLFASKSLTNQQFVAWNQGLALFHAIQGALILFLSSTKVFPVETSFLSKDPLASEVAGQSVLATASHHLFDLNIAYLVALFFFASAVTHILAASVWRKRYEADLKKGMNRFRWLDYAVSEGIMLVAIAVLAGVTELSLLVAVFVFTAVMNLAGLGMEVFSQYTKGKSHWLPMAIGGLAGLVPWLIIATYLWGSHVYGQSAAPTYLCWLAGTAFVLSLGFAANMYLQYKKTGKWQNYLHTETTYMMLNWALKTAVAWQIFAGVLHT